MCDPTLLQVVMLCVFSCDLCVSGLRECYAVYVCDPALLQVTMLCVFSCDLCVSGL